MSRTRLKAKGRSESGPFVAVPKCILQSDHYANLSPRAVKLLLDLAEQFNGNNNGDLTASSVVLRKRGWKSNSSLGRARDELERTGFIVQTRQGGRHVASLYAITWRPIDECRGKLDRQPTRIALNYWKDGTNPETRKTESVPRPWVNVPRMEVNGESKSSEIASQLPPVGQSRGIRPLELPRPWGASRYLPGAGAHGFFIEGLSLTLEASTPVAGAA